LCDFFFYKKRKQEKECTSFRTLVSYTFGKKNSGHFDQIKEVALATFFFLNWFESLVIKKEKNQFCYFQRSSSSPLTCLFFFCLLLPSFCFANLHVHQKPPCYFKREFCL
jgi:hypothetical protein